MTINSLLSTVSDTQPRSAWNKGVKIYACELLTDLVEGIQNGYIDADVIDSPKALEKALLDGACDWSQYSWGGCSLIYDEDIAVRLCTPSELKRTKFGNRKPNANEEWLDTQARALWQASRLILETAAR